MIDWTDRHCRFFHRLLAPRAFLYTEMLTAAALHHGEAVRFLTHSESESPLALQLGGADPALMAAGVRDAVAFGFDEFNINVGCPSDRVQSGRFGACLMAHPEIVRNCFVAMRAETDRPITVKTRLGIDNQDSDEFLFRLLDPLVDAGLAKLILHARIAILDGLSPKENRSVPPLNYERVYRVRERYPHIELIINGGIAELADVKQHLSKVDGVMIGREAYQNPWFLYELASALDARSATTREAVLAKFRCYAAEQLEQGVALRPLIRPLLGLFAGQPGARHWRRGLSENAGSNQITVLDDAYAAYERAGRGSPVASIG